MSSRGRLLVVAHTGTAETIRVISAGVQRGASEYFMKKTDEQADDLRPEYDFASMRGGVRGKYVKRLREETNLVLLDPEVAAAFPTEEAVNAALRGVLNTTKAVRQLGGLPNRTLRPSARKARRNS